MSKTGRVTAAALLGLTAALPAAAECNLRLTELSTVIWRAGAGGVYNPFDPGQFVQESEFSVRHRGESCDFFVTFSPGNTGNFERAMESGGVFLRYNLFDTPSLDNILKDVPEALSTEVLSGHFDATDNPGGRPPRGDDGDVDEDKDKDKDKNDDEEEDGSGGRQQVKRLSFFMPIEPLQIVPPASNYNDRIRVSVYEGVIGNERLRDERTIQVRARVASVAQISIGPLGADFDPQRIEETMDFGTLVEGERRVADLLVRANTGYRVTMDSANRGVLVHDEGRPSRIPYEFRFDDQVIDLTRPNARVDSGGGPTPMTGDRHLLEVTIGEIGMADPGKYQDTITFAVRAR